VSGATFDLVTVRWANGEVRVGTPAAENTLEAFLEETSLTTAAQAVEYGTLWLANHGTTIDQCTIGIDPHRPETTPYAEDGLHKGDLAGVKNRAGTVEPARVHSLGFTGLDRNGRAKWAVTVGTRKQEQEIATERQLAKIGGSMGGSFASSTLSAAPSYGSAVAGQLPTESLPLADADAFTTEAPYDRTSPYRFAESKAIIRLACQADSLIGTNASVIEVWRISYTGGAPAATLQFSFSWPGTRFLFQAICDVVFPPDTAYQLRVHTAGAHQNIAIQPIGSSAN
jgi:hypothetical protein